MKYLFALINLILLAGSVFFCVDIFSKTVLKAPFFMPEINAVADRPADLVRNQERNINERQDHEIIVQRNLFKVEIERKERADKDSSGSTEELEPTTMSLALWGTVTGGTELYAVIEDKKSRLQALYQEGDSIQDATVKRILKKEVILTYQGKDQILEIETDSNNSSALKNPLANQLPGKNVINVEVPLPQTPQSFSGNTGGIIPQIRYRTFFTKGAPDGVMVYGIKPDSVFNRAGLRNGDIVKEINGIPVASIEEASSAIADLESDSAAKITLVRSGEIKEIFYRIGQFNKEQGHEGEPAGMKEEKLSDPQEQSENKTQAPEDIEPEKFENSEDKNKGEKS